MLKPCLALLAFVSLVLAACGSNAAHAPTDTETENGEFLDQDQPDGNEEQAEAEPEEEEPALDRWGFPEDHVLLAPGFLNIAHRGGGLLAPEESLEAYRSAAAVGADMLEMDLHATSDGVVVLHHDDTVDRITDGTGKIKELTFAQLRELDAGYAFTPDGGQTYPFRGQGVRVATFREVLTEFPTAIFSAEIKQSSPSIVDAVLEILADTGMEDRVILISFYDRVVREIRQKNPRIVTGAATGEMLTFGLLTEEDAADYEPPCPIFQLPDIEPAWLTFLQQFGVKVQIWTINDPVEMRAWLDMGVDGVMTDDPALLESIIREREQELEGE